MLFMQSNFGREAVMKKNSLLPMSGVMIAVMLTAGDARTEETESLALIEHAATDAVTDTGAAGDSSADLLTFANELLAADNATKVGTDSGFCIRVTVGQSWECFWTLTLADGQITAEGPFLDAGDSVLAVTGGTGKYVNARGEMALH